MTRGRDGGARGRITCGGGVPELQQAGADAAQVVPAEGLLPDLLPRVVGESPVALGGGCHVYVAPGEVGHQRAPSALFCGVPVEEGQ